MEKIGKMSVELFGKEEDDIFFHVEVLDILVKKNPLMNQPTYQVEYLPDENHYIFESIGKMV